MNKFNLMYKYYEYYYYLLYACPTLTLEPQTSDAFLCPGTLGIFPLTHTDALAIHVMAPLGDGKSRA